MYKIGGFRWEGSIMNLKYIKAIKDDADLMIKIYNASFYDDYIKYGECPAYGRTRASMEESIEKFPKFIIYNDDNPIGAISVADKGNGEYYLGCLCVIPEFQGKGIGTQAFKFMLDFYSDWNKVTLITPADKEENIAFYTKKCGFKIDGTEMDGNVKVVHFLKER
jgi:ribosomal protein S18 acetylase RimI-like enzyme